jgi:hypothetical protein
MCSLCGVIGGKAHWTEASGPSGASSAAGNLPTRLGERQERVRLLNAVLKSYGLTLDDWAGTAYVVRTRTGRSALVENLAQLWASAEGLLGRSCDPLDPDLLAALARGAGAAES